MEADRRVTDRIRWLLALDRLMLRVQEGCLVWNPADHSDQDNLTWSFLRAVEWGRWPIFLSQPVAP